MDNKDEIKLLEKLISAGEIKEERLKYELKRVSKELTENKKRLSFLENGGQDCFPVGTKLLFKDEDNFELEIAVVMNYKENYNALLLTDYSNEYELMKEYFIFDYNCRYTNTLVERLEEDYNLTFVKVIED